MRRGAGDILPLIRNKVSGFSPVGGVGKAFSIVVALIRLLEDGVEGIVAWIMETSKSLHCLIHANAGLLVVGIEEYHSSL